MHIFIHNIIADTDYLDGHSNTPLIHFLYYFDRFITICFGMFNLMIKAKKRFVKWSYCINCLIFSTKNPKIVLY